MHNHVKSRIEIEGSKEEVIAVLSEFSTHHERTPNLDHGGRSIYAKEGVNHSYGWLDETTGMFSRRDKEDVKGVPGGFVQDFTEAFIQFPDLNKVVPSPEGMGITSDGWLSPMDNQFSSHTLFKDHLDKMREFFEKNPSRKEETLKNFLQGVENYVNHGHGSWYSWNVANWGTKWNTYSCKKINDNVFEFETAWSGVRDMIEKISYKFPTVTFIYEWADEDTGSNVGRLYIKNNTFVPTNYIPTSNEAYELAFKLNPEIMRYYKKQNGLYVHEEDEE